MPKISIIIPTWNRENLIQNAIKSVQNQTIKDIEILICDDGSTDNTEQVVKDLSQKDSRIKWVKGDHSGKPATPRNNGIKIAKGEWMAFLDSDDEWLPKKLEKQLNILKKRNLKASSTNAYRYISKINKKETFYKKKQGEIKFKNLLKKNNIICSSVLVHKSILKKISGFPTEKNMIAIEDYALWLRISTKINFVFINKPMLIYRDDPQNSIRRKNIKNFLEQKKNIFKNFLDWSKKKRIKEKKIILFYYYKTLFQIKMETIKKFLKR